MIKDLPEVYRLTTETSNNTFCSKLQNIMKNARKWIHTAIENKLNKKIIVGHQKGFCGMKSRFRKHTLNIAGASHRHRQIKKLNK